MEKKFSTIEYHRCLQQGNARGAAAYLAQFTEKHPLVTRFTGRFAGSAVDCPTDSRLVDDVISAYVDYYRAACWQQMKPAAAEIILQDALRDALQSESRCSLEDMEASLLPAAVAKAGFHFYGLRERGFHSAYIWRNTQKADIEITLPSGTRTLHVKLPDSFVLCGWPDWISFGELRTRGWIDADGDICCIRTNSEDAGGSALAYLAQQAEDRRQYPRIRTHELEYRARLAELMCAESRTVLQAVMAEADTAPEACDSAYAACRIVQGLAQRIGCDIAEVPAIAWEEILSTAQVLFDESAEALKKA